MCAAGGRAPENSAVSKIIPNSFQVPNYYADEVMHYLTGAELKILLYAIRRTFGFQRATAKISLSQFCSGTVINGQPVEQGTGLARGSAIKAIDDLVKAKILLLVSKGKGKESSEFGINLDSSDINLQHFIDRQALAEAAITTKIQKANAGRRAKQQRVVSEEDTPEVRSMNRSSGSSDDGLAVHPMTTERFIERTSSGSSDEPPFLLHRNQVETKIETKGENQPPFDSFDFSKAAAAYEATVEEIQDALRKIFPALPIMSGRIGELTTFVLGLKAPVSYVLAWPQWFKQRFNGQIANHFKFGDTFSTLAEEGIGHDAWLNGSVGSRFVAGCSGYLGKKPVPAAIASRITSIGHWLDDNVTAKSRDEWYSRNLTPTYFEQFWSARFTGVGKPSPDSVMKYWSEFTIWVAAEKQ